MKKEKRKLFALIVSAEDYEAVVQTIAIGNQYGLYDTKIIEAHDVDENSVITQARCKP